MTQLERIQLKLNESKKVNVEFGLFDDVEGLADKVATKLISFDKLKDELKTNGQQLYNLYNTVEKKAKELGVEADRSMPEANKTIGKLLNRKLL